MPKRNKQKDKTDPNEGRPAAVTLADFITVKIPNKCKAASEIIVPTTAEAPKIEQIPEKNAKDDGISWPVDVPKNTDTAKFFICRTKKGGVPVDVQSRSSGKKVTLIESVHGDAGELLQQLKSRFGTGGLCRDGIIELQGDCKNKVAKYLTQNKQFLRPYGTTM